VTTAFQSDSFQNNAFQIDFSVSASVAGVSRGRKPPFIKARNREEIGDFLKAQANLRNPNLVTDEPIVFADKELKRLERQEKREKEMRRKAQEASEQFLAEKQMLETQTEEALKLQLNNLRTILILGGSS
jgi:predicted nucleotide-binding protein (sugar kinase/HSP70/actin superfamily)